MHLPLVSVLIPVKNGALYLSQAIRSVLDQSYNNFELIILDDSSTDDSFEIAHNLASTDSRIKVLQPKANGFAQVLNYGLQFASGEFIARLDSDDLMRPDRLKKQVSALSQSPTTVLVASRVTYIDNQSRPCGTGGPAYHSSREISRALEKDIIIGFHHPSVMFRRGAVLDCGGYKEGMWPVEDVDLWTRLAETGADMMVIKDPLTSYRVHQLSGSRGLDSVRKLAWIKHRATCRRSGSYELSWEEFNTYLNEQNFFGRLNRERKLHGKFYFRQASQNFFLKSYFSSALNLIYSAFLTPEYAYKKAINFLSR